MRCQTCGHTAHPGYVAWRGGAEIGSLFHGALIPCPDCGGSVVAGACDGFCPSDPATARPYRCYLLDERGMIHYAEIVDAELDDDARQHAAALLATRTQSSAIEVWDRRRAVHMSRRPAPAAPRQPAP